MVNNLPDIVKSLVGDSFYKLVEQIDETVAESTAITIIAESHVDKGSRYIKIFKELKKLLEKERTAIVNPMNKQVKAVNEAFKIIHGRYSDELTRLEDELKVFIKKQRELERIEKEKEQKELEEQLMNEAEIFDDPDVLNVIPEVEIKRQKLSDKTAHLTTMRVKKWRIVNEKDIPRDYLTVNEKMVNEIRKGAGFEDSSSIPGIEFYYEEVPRV